MNYEELLINLLKKDDRFIVLTAENRAAIRNLPSVVKDRFIDVGIAEQTMIGMAAGLALRGRIPIVHALSTFLTMRAFEFIRTDVGIANLSVKLIGAVPGFLSEANGPTHQAIEDISIMRGIPGINIFCPSDEDEMLSGIEEIFFHNSPFYVRFNNLKNLTKHSDFKLGKAEIISHGNDITILTYGTLLKQAVESSDLLEDKGISAGVINLRTLKPIDTETILNVCRENSLLVTLEDHFITGGLFSILSEILVRNKIICNVLPVALNDKWFKPALFSDVLRYEGFTPEAISEKISRKFETTKKKRVKNLLLTSEVF